MDIQKQRLEKLKTLGFNPNFVLDIGACIGEWSKMVHTIFPTTNILMFEPNDKNENKLLAAPGDYNLTLLGNENKIVDYYAVIEKPGVYNTGNSIFLENTKNFRGDNFEIQKKEMKTLDSVLQNYPIKNPEFIKMDVQGAELLVLEGAKKTLETVEFVLLEAQTMEYNKNAPMFAEVNQKMDEYGYQTYDILGLHYATAKNLLIQLDVLYCKKGSKYIIDNFS